jgi:cell division septation protein DedD
MPSREPELYKDKIEVSLDGRQIFYLFFGGAVIVGMVFVLGVMVGRRVEARGHLDRADPPAASDPLAALDRLERSDHLSFHGALTGSETPTDVEKAIGELEKRRAASRGDGPDRPGAAKMAAEAHAAAPPRAEAAPSQAAPPRPEARPEARSAPRPEARADGKSDAGARAEPGARPEADKPRVEADKPRADKRDGDKRDGDKRDGDKRDGDKRDGDKRDGDKKVRKHDDGGSSGSKSDRETRPDRDKKAGSHGESASRSEAHAEARGAATEARGEPEPGADKLRFTLQLSSFQDKAEAEAFLSATKAAGFQPYLTEADVTGKGTFYRVRLGSYRSLEAANDAKAQYEKSSRKTAQVMRL